MMRGTAIIVPALALLACQSEGQTTTNAPPASNSPSLASENATEKGWSSSASVYTYIVPDDRDYVQPTVTFDRDWLHLQARYNYENLEAGSAWAGYNFSGGERLAWEFTPVRQHIAAKQIDAYALKATALFAQRRGAPTRTRWLR